MNQAPGDRKSTADLRGPGFLTEHRSYRGYFAPWTFVWQRLDVKQLKPVNRLLKQRRR